jgi:tetratricopeptide (TPR) repeat protein/serine/threonine protein kinase
MTEPSLPEESIFAQALEIASAVERVAFLDRVCGNNPALRAEIEALLRAHERSGDLLDLPEHLPVTTDLPAREGPGTVIGPYKLLEQIGEGGMGTVWMAEQTEPIQRRVAVKVVKEGMDSRQVLARFEAERQALALMEHPNIAKVLDAGRTPSGRPYFVMELVKGQPITKYCDDKRLGVRQRLELFGDVCRAVQHAHQKGIIHRDLKPSNVLVAPYDGKPVVKVIDFGVAKATGQRLTDRTLFTGFGALVGTPEYMSPEQAEVNNQDIDTRSDIYSLGVLLYELLTGSTPLTRQRLKEAALLEVLRVIREEEPPRPSTRLSESKDALPAISAQRQTEPAKLTRLVRGELDWIVMKALEKDRNRRYETANGFALDVQRYLADEPVQACPPSAAYRLRKFARRNKGRLAVAGLILFFLVVLGGGGGWVVRDRAAREEAAAKERRDRERRLTARVEQMLDDVDRLEREQKWTDALAAAKQAEATLAGGEADDAVRRRVADARRDLEFVARLDRIRQEIALSIEGSGFNNRGAARDYLRAFRDYGVDVAQLPAEMAVAALRARPALATPFAVALHDWVLCLQVMGEGKPSWEPLVAVARGIDPDPLRDRLRGMWKELVTPEWQAGLRRLAVSIDVKTQSPATLDILGRTLAAAHLPDAAVQILRDSQYAHPGDFFLNLHLGYQLLQGKDHMGAVRYFSAAVSIQPESVTAHNNLGVALDKQGKVDEAVAEYRKAVALDPKEAHAHSNLGGALKDQGKLDEAVAECRKAIALDPKFAFAHNNLGRALNAQGKVDEAVAEYRKAIALGSKLALAHYNLGLALTDQGKVDEAVAEYRKAIALDPKFALAHTNLGIALAYQKKLDEAVEECRKAIALDPTYALAHTNLGAALRERGKLDEAVAEYRKAIALDPKHTGTHTNLGVALYDQGKRDEAVAEFRTAIALDPKYALAHDGLGNALYEQRKLDEAVAECRKAIELDPKLANAHITLGIALCDQGQRDEGVTEFRKAIALDPKLTKAHYNLGVALKDQGKLDDAIAEHRRAVEIDPKLTFGHYGLAVALQAKGQLDEAIVEYRQAIRLKEDFAEAHCNLGQALQRQGEFRQALEERRRGHELGSKRAGWPYPSARWVRQCERLVELDGKLPGFLEGKTTPASPRERIELAGLCTLKRLHRAAAHFYAEAFAAEPKLANDPRAAHRYNAACAAALAGCGQGKDADKLDDKERAGLRRQALDWLRADLDEWGRLLDKEPDKGRPAIAQQTRHWLVDTDFAGVRGQQALAKLPEPERESWQKLWDDVANTLARAQAATTPETKAGAK